MANSEEAKIGYCADIVKPFSSAVPKPFEAPLKWVTCILFAAAACQPAAWTVMAATLTELWSRLLLPADAPEARAAEAEAEALRRQLLDRAHVRVAADWLDRQPQLGREVFSRGAPEIAVEGRTADITALLRACLVALKVSEAQAAELRPRPLPLWSAADAIGRVRELLPVLPDGSALQDFLPGIGLEAPRREVRCGRRQHAHRRAGAGQDR